MVGGMEHEYKTTFGCYADGDDNSRAFAEDPEWPDGNGWELMGPPGIGVSNGGGGLLIWTWRRPEPREWVPLSSLRPGAVFEAKTGWRGVRTADDAPARDIVWCADLGDGKRVQAGGSDLVKEIL
jgi:hypothetical protein